MAKEKLIAAAVQMAQTGDFSARRAAQVWGVPERTVNYRLKGRSSKVGKPTTLSREEESTVVEVLLKLSKLNVGLSKRALFALLKEIQKGKFYTFESQLHFVS